MPTKEAIRRELDFSKNMADILDVMKQLAQSQFSVSKRIVSNTFAGLVVSFDRIFELALALPDKHPLIHAQCDKIGIIVTTSDQSFMGSLNSKITKKAKETAGNSPAMFLVCGRKGAMKFKFNHDPFVGFPAIKEGPSMLVLSTELANFIIKEVCEKRLGRVYVVSAESTSFTSQAIRATQLLPFSEIVKKREIFKAKKIEGNNLILAESQTQAFATFTARLWIRNALFFLFKNNKPAEYSALATQMEGSFDNVKKVIGKLNVLYKRARNEKVDASMREIFVSTMVTGGGGG